MKLDDGIENLTGRPIEKITIFMDDGVMIFIASIRKQITKIIFSYSSMERVWGL